MHDDLLEFSQTWRIPACQPCLCVTHLIHLIQYHISSTASPKQPHTGWEEVQKEAARDLMAVLQ